LYGSDDFIDLWQSGYHRHQEHKYTVPVLSVVFKNKLLQDPLERTKHTVFFSQVLRAIPPELVKQYVVTATGLQGLDFGFLLDVLHAADTAATRTLFKQFATSVKASGTQRELLSAIQDLSNTPVMAAYEWPFPLEHPELFPSGAAAAASFEAGKWAGARYPWEVIGEFGSAKYDQRLTFQVYADMASLMVLKGLWGGFVATGDRAYVHRMLDAAHYWDEAFRFLVKNKGMQPAEASMKLIPCILDLDEALPKELELEDLSAATAADSYSSPERRAILARTLRITLGRRAMVELYAQSRSHPAVMQCVGEQISGMAWYVADLPVVRREQGQADALEAALVERDFSNTYAPEKAEGRLQNLLLLADAIRRMRTIELK
jgi:hypothetical protein